MNVLGIETSCDETAAGVVCDGRRVLSSVILSQADQHGPYGGVVPEIACRSHVAALPGVIEEAVRRSGSAWDGLDAVAVTWGPGLASSLLVGLSAARALAARLGRPLVGVNHLEAHVYSVFLDDDGPRPEEVCPFLALVVSGGHTCLVRVERLGRYRLLGQTIDDAAGEAFDKGANLLGLGYPGGPAVDRAAAAGRPDAVRFPRGRQKEGRSRPGGLDPELCFSFSGVKTALLYHLREHPLRGGGEEVAALAASYQEAIVDALVERCDRGLRGEACLAAVGGVSLNRRLRARLKELAAARGVRLLLAKPGYCGDNGAMVAGLAGAGQGVRGGEAMGLDADPNLPIGSVSVSERRRGMNSVERVHTALRNRQPDRVPIVEFVLDLRVARALVPDCADMADAMDRLGLDGVGCGARFRRVEERADGTYRDEWGCVYKPGPEMIDHPIEGPIRNLDDARRYVPPDPDAPHRLEVLRDVVRRYKGRRAICFHHRAAFMWSAYLMGIENLLAGFIGEPELANLVMDKVLEANLRVVRNAIRAGAEVVVLGDDYAHNLGPMMSPGHFREFLLPRLKRMIDLIHAEGALCIKHTDGNIYSLLDMIVSAGPDAVNPIEPAAGMQLAKVKALVGDRVCLVGNIDCGHLLPMGTPEQVREAVRQAVADAGAGGGFILSSSNSIHSSCRPENYRAMIEACREFGAYG